MRVTGAGAFQIEGKASTKVLRQKLTPFFGATARKSAWRRRVRKEGEGGDVTQRKAGAGGWSF